MADVVLKDVRKSFGAVDVIKGVDLEAKHGEFVVFVGPSGCGKSTLLRMICGLEKITSGQLLIGDEDMSDVEASDRGTAMVFQSYALYPHMSVADNMSFGLRMAKTPQKVVESRVKKAAEILQITHLLDRKPKDMSGGQRQRVAIGRAIVREPKVFLFDEPLSNLDAELRVQMRVELSKLHNEIGATMIYVTHDQVEAMTMADKIVVLRDGRIEQIGSPLDLYMSPDNKFVAGFIGSPRMNFLRAQIVGSANGHAQVSVPDAPDHVLHIPLRDAADVSTGQEVTIGIRPEHFLGTPEGPGLKVTIDVVENLGGIAYAYGRTNAMQDVILKAESETPPRSGMAVTASINDAYCHLFDKEGRTLSTSAGAIRSQDAAA
ncbi:sn-glycerol-3-phosphate ABC transporter ATP-binding protein UgpC [Alphaproteobacteria bacterium GH1-50]|uniref:sn-glycerol-3-phosphate ABC transporter ATP-binding protein UgpC n=1 Tax=Kangsaoukella pontilimi TaxID=2691042 RepID=A0A7C9IF85_9RHOB|nr:sn-glycerol-3-phosphate ABC transporter ATP-binding protein UgpC [Kangsaoukella pontilimi]MXQ07364.1 sn-glycerol-3-phosphate ABC transporter ATP-binding protein UgpC [Kangsaoukella pontilimi]